MANRIENEQSFDSMLDKLARGLNPVEKAAVNLAGTEAFKKILKPNVPRRENVNGEEVHVQDALITETRPSGRVEIGFSSESNKGFIARLLNDGWVSVGRGQRGTGKKGQTHPGLQFWDAAEVEAKGVVKAAVDGAITKAIKGRVKR